jgi:serine beta-lactamase-like protein LACTB
LDVKKNWFRKLLIMGAVGAGLLPLGLMGLWSYVSATAPTLHPNPADVRIATRAGTPARWAAAVQRASQIARDGLTQQNLPGLSVAVGVGGELVWAEGLGWANMADRVPVELDTPFRIGSASMALTSAAAGILIEQGRLKLDEEIQTYVPSFPKKSWPVTLRQVMGHMAGIRGDAGDEENLRERCGETTEGLKRFAGADLRFQPGTKYHFSLYNWVLVSAAIESAAEEPFFTFMRRNVFEPLGMSDTKSDSGKVPIPNQPVYYFPRFAADPKYGPQDPSEVEYSCFFGASAFLTTPSDMVRFLMAFDAGKVVQPPTVRQLQTSQRTVDGAETGYGLGWDLETITVLGEQMPSVGHDGDLMDGQVSSFLTIPSRGIVVAVISNIAFADTASVARSIAEAFADQQKVTTVR